MKYFGVKMKVKLNELARNFAPIEGVVLKDMGNIELEDDEQITFIMPSGKKNDITKKDWGLYLGNSLNYNLKQQGFKTALVSSSCSGGKRLYINLVEIEKLTIFYDYLKQHGATVIKWLDEMGE